MFEVTRVDEKRLDIRLSGKLDSEGMKRALDDLVNESAGIEHGRMLYELVDFHLPSIGAIAIEFSRLPSMFGFIRKFDRAAVLTERGWIKKASEIEGALIPGLEIRAFGLDQKSEAEAWLNES